VTRGGLGPLHDPVKWYKIVVAGAQVAQWGFQNKSRSRWTGTSCIVLEVPQFNLHTSMCGFVSRDWIVQRAYFGLVRTAKITSCLREKQKLAIAKAWTGFYK